jgi:hypothetical protein
MCPCISSKSKYAVCSRYESGVMVPSVYQRENYCFDAYELCPLFYNSEIRAELRAINQPEEVII